MKTTKQHSHKEIINQWLNDQSVGFEVYSPLTEQWGSASLKDIFLDINGKGLFRVKEKDPYADLRKAEKEGKRIVWQDSAGVWRDFKDIHPDGSHGWAFDHHVDRYKIVDPDILLNCAFYDPEMGGKVYIEVKKCGITGKITARAV